MQAIDSMTQAFMTIFQLIDNKFERMKEFNFSYRLLSVSELRVRSWFGVAKWFPKR